MGTPLLPAASGLQAAKQMFLTKKEKVVGGLVTVVGGTAVVGVGGYFALPYINHFLTMAIEAFGKGLVLIGAIMLFMFALFFILDPRTWTNLWYLQRVFSAKATRVFVKMNHLEIMQIFANDYLGEMHEKILQKEAEVEGVEGEILAEIKGNQTTVEQKTEEAESVRRRYFNAARGRWSDDEQEYLFNSLSTDVGLAQDSNRVLADQLANAQGWKKSLSDLERAFRFEKRNTLAFVQVLTRQYNLTQKVASVGASVQKYMVGTDDKKKVFDQAVQYTRQRVAQYTAIANTALRVDPAFVKQADLRTNVYADRMYRQVSSGASALLSSAEATSKRITDGGSVLEIVTEKRREPVPVYREDQLSFAPPSGGKRKYRNLLDK